MASTDAPSVPDAAPLPPRPEPRPHAAPTSAPPPASYDVLRALVALAHE